MGNDICIGSKNPEYCEDLASQCLQPSDGDGVTIDLRDGTSKSFANSDLCLQFAKFRASIRVPAGFKADAESARGEIGKGGKAKTTADGGKADKGDKAEGAPADTARPASEYKSGGNTREEARSALALKFVIEGEGKERRCEIRLKPPLLGLVDSDKAPRKGSSRDEIDRRAADSSNRVLNANAFRGSGDQCDFMVSALDSMARAYAALKEAQAKFRDVMSSLKDKKIEGKFVLTRRSSNITKMSFRYEFFSKENYDKASQAFKELEAAEAIFDREHMKVFKSFRSSGMEEIPTETFTPF